MSLRFLLAALSAALAPFGVEGEAEALESGRVPDGVLPVAERLLEAPGSPPADRATAPDAAEGAPDRGAAAPPAAGPPVEPPSWRPGAVRAPRRLAAGRTPSGHLARCGHEARHLDLPPPSLA